MYDAIYAALVMAEAHRDDHPECARQMDYIIVRLRPLLDDGK